MIVIRTRKPRLPAQVSAPGGPTIDAKQDQLKQLGESLYRYRQSICCRVDQSDRVAWQISCPAPDFRGVH